MSSIDGSLVRPIFIDRSSYEPGSNIPVTVFEGQSAYLVIT